MTLLLENFEEETDDLMTEGLDGEAFKSIIGRSPALRRVLLQAQRVAPIDTTVLIMGETGTGKELLAQAIHNLSPRRRRALVKVNCAALPASLIETELFGHEKGAFTGANNRRIGRFDVAHGGTILLDEIGDLPLELQPKLLRVIEQQEFERVGGVQSVNVDVRIIAATNRNLKNAVGQGLFRADLYYRLSSFPITLPPLRERPADIPILLNHFVNQFCSQLGRESRPLSEEALTWLCTHNWPGNVRELKNISERLVIDSSCLRTVLLEHSEGVETKRVSLYATRVEKSFKEGEAMTAQIQYELILGTLRQTRWRVDGPMGAAALLNLNPSTLRSRMKKLGINRPRIGAGEL